MWECRHTIRRECGKVGRNSIGSRGRDFWGSERRGLWALVEWVEAARIGGGVYSGNAEASLPHSKVGASRRLRIGLFRGGRLRRLGFVPIWFWAGFRGCTRWLRGLG